MLRWSVAGIRGEFIRQLFANQLWKEKKEFSHLELIGAQFEADENTIFGKPNSDYIRRELAWYISQSCNIYDLQSSPPEIWRRIADHNGMINSNYGHRIEGLSFGVQYDRCLNELLRDRVTRRAVMIYAGHDTIEEGIKHGRNDQLCTMYVQVMLRNCMMHYHVHMRSCDAVLGYRNDLAWHRYVRDRLLNDIKHRTQDHFIAPAPILWHADSLHVYKHDVHFVYKLAKEQGNVPTDTDPPRSC